MSHYKKQSVLEVKLFEFSLFGVNTYFVWDTLSKEAAVIDPAMSDPRECEVFSSFVTEHGLILKYLLCTHLHIDHTFGIEYIEANYKIGLHASEADDFFGKQRAAQARMFRLRMAEPAPLHIDSAITEGEKFYLGKSILRLSLRPATRPVVFPSIVRTHQLFLPVILFLKEASAAQILQAAITRSLSEA